MGHEQPIDFLLKYVVPILLFIFIVPQLLRKFRDKCVVKNEAEENEIPAESALYQLLSIEKDIVDISVWTVRNMVTALRIFIKRGVVLALVFMVLFFIAYKSKQGFEKLFHINQSVEYTIYYERNMRFMQDMKHGSIPWESYYKSLLNVPYFDLFSNYLNYSLSLTMVFFSLFSFYLYFKYKENVLNNLESRSLWVLFYSSVV